MQRRDPGPDFSSPGRGDSDPVAEFRPGGDNTPLQRPSAARRPDEPPVISVAELDNRIKRLVESGTQDLRVVGEVNSMRVHSSGHAYFKLKDENEAATIDCVMYKTAAPRARSMLTDGARVVLIGRATVYAPRGQLQFVATDVRPVGRGALLEALERLKQRLSSEGLFAPERKRPLPADPSVIGVVTSGDGAAIHDIITVSFRRGAPRILLARATVQGPGAALSMVRALDLLARVPEVEVIILGRGGGSADDLAAYNDEGLVRKVASLSVPVVSAVGHEIDITLTDLVADARAATPSQAAELLVPDRTARRALLVQLYKRMYRALKHGLSNRRANVDRLAARVGSPAHLVAERQQQIDEADMRLERAFRRLLSKNQNELAQLERRMGARHPRAVVASARGCIEPLEVRLGGAMQRRLERLRTQFGRQIAGLEALSPLAVLSRGYAIATTETGKAVRAAKDVHVGDRLTIRVHQGKLATKVVEVLPEEPSPANEAGRDE
ncbi:MAG TPA: exodeoxyribonuclease VII large subunit [Polyangium sp.]|nr:exodeoxyribonuclease VII large subunit [Polyangium sp.]